MSLSHRHSAPLYLFVDVPGSRPSQSITTAAASSSLRRAPRTSSIPLKLPPRLQHPAAASSAASSATTSPTALSRVQSWSPFATSRRHGGFDPFAEALKKVRRDGAAPRRANSFSPLRVRGVAAATTSLNSSGTAAAAQKASARPTWRRRKGVNRFLCRAVMASAGAAPRALRPRRRRDDGAPCR